MSNVILSVLGTAQDAGIPQPNCFCDHCQTAINDPKYKRSASSLAIIDDNKWHLIDATPDLKEQMVKLQMTYNLKGQLMTSIFLTHAHLGHYPGLLFLGREAINANQIPVYAGKKMKRLLETQAPWSLLTALKNIKVNKITNHDEVSISNSVMIKAIDIPHRNEFSETFGFWIKGPHKKVLYIPDIDKWEEWDLDVYDMCQEADICLLDGTFFSSEELKHIGRYFKDIPHPVMTETMDRLEDHMEFSL